MLLRKDVTELQRLDIKIEEVERQYRKLGDKLIQASTDTSILNGGLIGWFEQQDRLNDIHILRIKRDMLKLKREELIKTGSTE